MRKKKHDIFKPLFMRRKRESNAAMKEMINLHKKLDGLTPNLAETMRYYEKKYWKLLRVKGPGRRMELGGRVFNRIKSIYEADGKIALHVFKEFRVAPLRRALQETFAAMSKTRAFGGFGRGTRRRRVRKIIKGLYREGKMNFEGEASADFRTALMELQTTLGKKDAASFIELFNERFRNEVGWARFYIRSLLDPTAVLARW